MSMHAFRSGWMLVPIAALALVAASSSVPAQATDANKAVAKRYVEEIVNKGKLEVADEIIAADYVYHGRGPAGTGPALVKTFVGMYRTAFPDIKLTIEDLLAEGDRVAVRISAAGTQKGPLGDVPATGKSVRVPAIFILRFAKGKVAEEWEVIDDLGMMEQLGAVAKD